MAIAIEGEVFEAPFRDIGDLAPAMVMFMAGQWSICLLGGRQERALTCSYAD